MNCYRCLVEKECDHQPAYALCQRCGAAICAKHLVEFRKTSPAGMAGAGISSLSFLCQHCYQLASGAVLSAQPRTYAHSVQKKREQKSAGFWQRWGRFRHKQQVETFNPETVVEEAELYLKRQRG